jgi:F420-dependent oxidoreductase-like protein
MIEIALMLEGQMGLNWPRWQKIAKLADDLGFAGLYRSDHFTNPSPPDQDSLELWTSLTWLATNTEHIEFGPLVSPFTFRHPSNIARMAAAVDDLSGGRLQLGLGAGWQDREHEKFGFALGSIPARLQRFEEGLEVVSLLLSSNKPVSYSGDYFNLKDALLLPRPQRSGGPNILIGGNGMQRTLPLAAKYAKEWNGLRQSPEDFVMRSQRLDELLKEAGREPTDLRRSLMAGCVFGNTEKEADKNAKNWGADTAAELRKNHVFAGTAEQILEQLFAFAEAGCQRVMLQWLDLDDMEGLEAMAKSILPKLNGVK